MNTRDAANRPPSQLYLVAPRDLELDRLEAALEAGQVACLLLRGAHERSAPLIEAAQARGCAVLVEDDPALAARLNADGVHLGPDGRVKAARAALGGDAIVGVQCGASRHAAMLAGEAGADYIAFAGRMEAETAAADPELLAWWQEMMEPPCVAMGTVGLEDLHALATAGADFVALEQAVWSHPEGPAAAIEQARRALAAIWS